MRPIFLALLTLTACTAHLRPHPDVRLSGEPQALKAVLVIPAALEHSTDDVGKFDSLSGSYAFDTGELLIPALKSVAEKVFKDVTVVQSESAAGKADVVIIVKRLKLVHPSMRSNDYTLRFDLSAKVTNSEGIQILDAVYNDELKALPAKEPSDALTSPVEKAIAATLERLAADLRTNTVALLPPAPVEVAVADAGEPSAEQIARAQSGEFSEFPPPPPPPAAEASDAGIAEVVDAGTEAVAVAVVTPPPPEPLIMPVVQQKPAGRGAGSVMMIGAGALLFAGGVLAPPITMKMMNLPGGTSDLAFIPLVGALLSMLTNPFLNQDGGALILTVAGTAAQVAGLALAIVGVVAGGGSSSTQPRKASLLLVPTISPTAVGLTLAVQ